MAGEFAFLSVEQVVALHDELIRRFELAAAYTVYIVMGRMFGDGNQRTRSAAALVFLEANGVSIRFRSSTLLSRMIELQRRADARPSPTAADLVVWFAEWLRACARPAP